MDRLKDYIEIFGAFAAKYLPESWYLTQEQVILAPGFTSLMSMMILGILISYLRWRA